MLKRILTAVVLLAVVFGTILGLRQVYVEFADIVAVAICCIGVYEMAQAFKKAEYNAIKASLISGCIIIYPLILLFEKTLGKGELGILLALVISLMIAIVEFTLIHKFELKDLLSTVFILIYPLGIFSTLILINHSNYGLLGIFLALLIPIMTDTMAYFVGITFKGKKLCPNISPKKTISGAIGGVLGGIIGAMLVFVLFDVTSVFVNFNNVGLLSLTNSLGASAGIYVAVGLVGGVLSELGDLGASWIKRKAGIKDFGKIFPGHGGIMDRLDSIIFTLPTVLFVISIVSAVNAI
ncbi:MAG: phosphatidate cytidylyltransferase [Clostridia bacterium]|nr:phosphatidate cytidylyltransferase [Clostridia bacterium]MDE7078485.1 phosphatidate cytidylyltransferase [Clostridia bacterium]